MVDELTQLGGIIAGFFEKLKKRVAWVVSSDLAHTHRADGPYGYCECAAPFDHAVQQWMLTLESRFLSVDATAQERAGAKSCGFTGLLMLDGGLRATSHSNWHSKLLAVEAPTYYGMGVAT